MTKIFDAPGAAPICITTTTIDRQLSHLGHIPEDVPA